MVLHRFEGTQARVPTSDDIPSIYKLLEPVICDPTQTKSLYASQKRKLKQLIPYYIKIADSVIIEDISTKEILGVYIGDLNNIIYIALRHKYDVLSTVLLFYIVLCEFHNKYAETAFVAPLKSQQDIFNSLRLKNGDKAVEINKEGSGIISIKAKKDIEQAFKYLFKEQI